MNELNLDKYGRMYYTPEFHFNNNVRMTDEELAYMCRFYEFDGRRSVSFALGRAETAIAEKYSRLERTGKAAYYRNLWYELWEKGEMPEPTFERGKSRSDWIRVAAENGIREGTFNTRVYKFKMTWEQAATEPLDTRGRKSKSR